MNAVEKRLGVVAGLLDVAQSKLERAFGANVVLVCAFVFLKVIGIFIDRIVCQVHEQIVKVVLCWRLILSRGKSAKAITEQVNAQGIYAAKKHVNPQVKFKSVDQKRLMQVTLYHIVFIFVKIV